MYVRAAEGEQRPRAIGRTHLICHRAAAWGRSELFLVGGEVLPDPYVSPPAYTKG
jgi:hypothetical protein